MSRLLRLLELGRVDENRFVAPTPSDGPTRLFGGQVASQSLRAATLTVEGGRRPHSFHAYFIRPGAPGVPLSLNVERTRDGRSFSTRSVTASQDGEPIFAMVASFHVDERGDDWQEPWTLDVPRPEECGVRQSPFSRFASMSPFEIRPIGENSFPRPHPFWVKTRGGLPDDPVLHACVLAFMSDMGVVGSARAPTSTSRAFAGASLDHAVWFHRPLRADEWLLFSVDPVTNAGARGLARGSFHRTDGTLVATVMQEALLRPTATVPLP